MLCATQYHEDLKSIRLALLAAAAIMAVIVAARMLFGPYEFGLLSVHTPLNPEGFFGLAITLLLLTRTTGNRTSAPISRFTGLLLAMGVAALGAIALWRALGLYFLHDDFHEVLQAHIWTPAMLRYTFTHGRIDGFFRPVGLLSLVLTARFSGFHPVSWHAAALAIHGANSVLVLFLARRLGASASGAAFAGALFAVHGIHPEAAAWIAGRFDLVATFFLLAGMLLFTQVTRHTLNLHAGALLCFALAALSKEAAFIFPLLVLAYVIWKHLPIRWTIPYFFLAAILFVYRWSLFGGIGGYTDRTTGRPAAFALHAGTTLKAVAVRLWTLLYFPLNWTTGPSLPFALLAAIYIGAMLWLAWRSRPDRAIWFTAAAILISVIPVLSLLAGSPDLEGSRVWYLPSVWFAILTALALDGVAARSRYPAAAAVLLFHFAALQHNLAFWEVVSGRMKAACTTGDLAIPDWIDGVPALGENRKECLEIGQITRTQP